jgi:hypothetical protein
MNGREVADQFGLANLNLPDFPQTSGFPNIYLGFGTQPGGSTFKPLLFLDSNYQGSQNVGARIGKHEIKVGVDYRHLSSHPNFAVFPTGFQHYAGPYQSLTSDPTYGFYDASAYYATGGSDIADLLLGLPSSVTLGLQLTDPVTRSWESHAFIQDAWQVSNRLVLNYGIRYEYQNPYREKNNLVSNFDLNTQRILLGGVGGNPQSLLRPDKNNFGPRFGIAYRMTSRTVLRAGYGVYFSPENDARNEVLSKNYPYATLATYYNSVYAGLPFTYTLDAGVPRQTSILIPPGASYLTAADIPDAKIQELSYVDPRFRTGYSQLYNITLQRELTPTLSLEAGYVASLSRKLPYAVGNLNRDGRLSTDFGPIDAQFAQGSGSYHSVQVKADKRLSHSLSFLGSYTFGKSLDNGPAPFNLGRNNQQPQDALNLTAERAVSSNDIRHNLVFSYIYELPWGNGKLWLSHLKPWQQAILGGWQVNGILQMRSGLPVNVVRNSKLFGHEGLRPNVSGDPNIDRDQRTLVRYFDTTVFSVAGLDAAAPGNAGRNLVRGPGFINLDFSTFKSFQLREHIQLQMRFEFFNLTNTPHFGNPSSDLSSGEFGAITGTVGNPRIIQFAAKLNF